MQEILAGLSRLRAAQGGMGVEVSLAGMAAAAMRNGMIGIISAAGLGFNDQKLGNFFEDNAQALRREIRKAREMANGVLGVNLMVALFNFYELLSVCIEEEVDLVFVGAGVCWDLPKYLKGKKTKLVVITSSGKGARVVCARYWRDFRYLPAGFVVEGRKAGGHLGFSLQQLIDLTNDPAFDLENILVDVLHEVEVYADRKIIPVLAAGGIFTGADVHRILRLGAAGVQIATRFVATHECNAHHNFKQAYVNAREEDLMIIQSPVGMPGRAIRNQFLIDAHEGKRRPKECVWHCIHTCKRRASLYCIIKSLSNAAHGNLDEGFVFAGANVGLVKEILPFQDVSNAMLNEYDAEEKRVQLL